jgi:hypothetical protein
MTADALERSGKKSEAAAAYRRLSGEYRGTWIDRVSRERALRLQESR